MKFLNKIKDMVTISCRTSSGRKIESCGFAQPVVIGGSYFGEVSGIISYLAVVSIGSSYLGPNHLLHCRQISDKAYMEVLHLAAALMEHFRSALLVIW